MGFTSVSYLLFLPLCLAAVFLVPRRFKNAVLLAGSWVFYLCAGSPGYLAFLVFGTLVAYGFGLLLQNCRAPKRRTALLRSGIAVQFAVLFLFKYAGLFTDFFAVFGRESGLLYTREADGIVSLIAPLGISYYTFQTVGYLIDVYRRKVPAERNFIRYALFVSFFPQITSGPIGRAEKLLPQLSGNYRFSYPRTVRALQLMLTGYFKKIAVADMLFMMLHVLYADVKNLNGLTLFFLTLIYIFWLYCDFSGWCDIAAGTARLFGIELEQNFDTPLFSSSVREFWRRWHKSLSFWLRDYLYFPLGGSRCSLARQCFNLMIVFLASGIWHGAGINFILWGALFGLFQIVETLFAKWHKPIPKKHDGLRRTGKNIVTYFFVSAAFVFFNSPDFSTALFRLVHQFTGWSVSAFAAELIGAAKTGFNSTPLLCAGYLAFCVLSVCILFTMDHYRCFKLHNGDISEAFCKMRTVPRWLCYYVLAGLIFAAFLMNSGYYGIGVSTAYAGF